MWGQSKKGWNGRSLTELGGAEGRSLRTQCIMGRGGPESG